MRIRCWLPHQLRRYVDRFLPSRDVTLMFDLYGKLITRWWWAVILFWVVLTLGIRAVAPRWDDITYDGDLAYLPATMPSYVGEQLLTEGFPQDRAKSQIVMVTARNDAPLTTTDIDVAVDIARRFKNYLGIRAFQRSQELTAAAERVRAGNAAEAQEPDTAERLDQRAKVAMEEAEKAFDDAIDLDDLLLKHHEERAQQANTEGQPAPIAPPRLAEAYWNRAQLHEHLNREDEAAADREIAQALAPALKDASPTQFIPETAAELPILDVWTWRDDDFGAKLGAKHDHARLVVLQLSNEFMATQNIEVLELVEQELLPVRQFAAQLGVSNAEDPAAGVQVGISGSAAVGGDMLRSAQESIKHTEVFTIVIVVAILLCVYRSPLLVIVPLITIWVALQVAMGTVALLTQLHLVDGFHWWDLKVFTTTKIFIVVILFGSGTDFCLFLISRYREELEHGYEKAIANARALAAIADALIASAMTTILGLSMMFFADFGKYRNSGPVIALCLFVTLMACLTLAPALLRACGLWLFWPAKIKVRTGETSGALDWFWHKTARWIVAYPIPILIGSVLIMFPAAWHGLSSGDNVTYDFLSGLADASPSKSGTKLLQQHFPVGESGPLTVVVKRSFDDPKDNFNETHGEGRKELAKLSELLHIDGVTSIRSVIDPRGEQRPGVAAESEDAAEKPKRSGLGAFLRRSAERAHRRTRELYVSQAPGMEGQLTRMELVLDKDPFDIGSLEILNQVDSKLEELKNQPGSYWKEATFGYAGATAGVRDLRQVTRADNQRIQLLVIVAVYLVLLAVLRRPLVCLYMILSVLFSYYVTIGATEAFFAWAYGPNYPGLDWKVPLFLFVILVAVGEDYNVYLATRVYEEQKKHGPFTGLRKAIVRTGGIITSCGVIMAGTFVSMTAGVWGELAPPWIANLFFASDVGALRGIVELGFALTLGVLLDTFIVRPILVPAFMALVAQVQARRPRNSGQRPQKREHAQPRASEAIEKAGG